MPSVTVSAPQCNVTPMYFQFMTPSPPHVYINSEELLAPYCDIRFVPPQEDDFSILGTPTGVLSLLLQTLEWE